MNNFWTGSRWFYRQCLTTFCYFLQPESRKWLFGKLHLCPSIKHRPNPMNKCFALVACFVCRSLGDSSSQRCPGKPGKERKTHIRLRLSCVLSNTHHLHQHKCEDVFKRPFFKEIV